jgi:hypothetical protein
MRIDDYATIDIWNVAAARRKLGIPTLGSNLPKGGTVGQVLTKLSSTDYDTAFVSPSTPIGLPASSVAVTITAAENIPAFVAVTSLGRIANSSNPSAGIGRVIGIALAAIALGFSGTVVESGEVDNPLWTWTPGDQIYVSGTGLASSAPGTGFVQQVGTAKSPTTIVVDSAQPILL